MKENDKDTPVVECYNQGVLQRLASAASQAAWPLAAQRIVPTDKAAQRRRSQLLRGSRLLHFGGAPGLFLCVLTASSMLSGGTLVLATLWQLWYLLLIPAFLLVALLMTMSLRIAVVPAAAATEANSGSQRASTEAAPAPLQWRSMAGLLGSPETPMPDPPALVRVLETFDLSQPGVLGQAWPEEPSDMQEGLNHEV